MYILYVNITLFTNILLNPYREIVDVIYDMRYLECLLTNHATKFLFYFEHLKKTTIKLTISPHYRLPKLIILG